MQSKSDEGEEVPTAYLIAKTERRSIMVLRTHEISKLLHNACKVCLFALLNHDVEKIVSPVGFGMCITWREEL